MDFLYDLLVNLKRVEYIPYMKQIATLMEWPKEVEDTEEYQRDWYYF
ncbi:MAG: hypothetical protein ACTSSK_08605 [Candidatus Heimdallarchaeota archaeon]